MKKILLGTTALVSLFAASAFADAPAVSVGGSLNFQAGFTDQEAGYRAPNTSGNSRNQKFANDTRVVVKAQGKADNGLTYGGVVSLLADVSTANDNSGLNSDKTYLFLESNFGRFEAGSNVGVSKTLKVDASTFARATGGIDGDWYRYVNANVGTTSGVTNYILTPDLPLDAGITGRGDSENASKITYYTPRFAGFQAGASYIPDSGNRGTAAAFSGKSDNKQFREAFDLGLNYTGQFNQVGVAASATTQWGNSEFRGATAGSVQRDLRSYALGLDVNFYGFTVGGSWADLRRSGQPTTLPAGSSRDQDFWTLGAAYVQGPIGASVTYLNSDRQDNKFDNVSIGADYQLAPGLVPYAEVSFFDIDARVPAVRDNSGTVLLLGTQLTF
jgi:hypothetical protein